MLKFTSLTCKIPQDAQIDRVFAKLLKLKSQKILILRAGMDRILAVEADKCRFPEIAQVDRELANCTSWQAKRRTAYAMLHLHL